MGLFGPQNIFAISRKFRVCGLIVENTGLLRRYAPCKGVRKISFVNTTILGVDQKKALAAAGAFQCSQKVFNQSGLIDKGDVDRRTHGGSECILRKI